MNKSSELAVSSENSLSRIFSSYSITQDSNDFFYFLMQMTVHKNRKKRSNRGNLNLTVNIEGSLN